MSETTVETLGPEALLAWCAAHGVPVRLLRPGVPTPTVPEAAAAVGVAPERVLKSLVLWVDGVPTLVIAAGEDRLVYPRLAGAFGVSRRRVRLASADEALELTGFPVGAMPPFGHRRPLPTWVDAARVRPGLRVVAGGGARDALLDLTTDDLLRATDARSARLTDADPDVGGDDAVAATARTAASDPSGSPA
ncbi:MAG: YbaK/EbsC family protein [Trueperaceae bacterium]|nr:YbaK/EbsC family protein [Trueperaceae bacterium]